MTPQQIQQLRHDFERRYAGREMVRRFQVDFDAARMRRREEAAEAERRRKAAKLIVQNRRPACTAVRDDQGNRFEQLKLAALAAKVTKAAIGYAIRHGTLCAGRRWYRVEERNSQRAA